MLEPTASGRSASRKRQLPIAHDLASRCSIDTMLPTREKASQNPVTTRSALIGAEALVRLLNSTRVREEFRLAGLVSAASTNEINARLARPLRERKCKTVSLHFVPLCLQLFADRFRDPAEGPQSHKLQVLRHFCNLVQFVGLSRLHRGTKRTQSLRPKEDRSAMG